MLGKRKIVLIDSNPQRRAAISFQLSHHEIHVEPLESLVEMSGKWERVEAVLIAADPARIAQSVTAMVENGKWLPIIAFDADPRPGEVIAAIRAGAVDFAEWPSDPAILARAIDSAIRNAPELGGQKRREVKATRMLRRLSKREREVLCGLADGKSNKGIGQQLAISPRTVEAHRAKMMAKIGATSSSEAIRIAFEGTLLA